MFVKIQTHLGKTSWKRMTSSRRHPLPHICWDLNMCYYCVCPNRKLIVIVQISICIFPNTKSFIFRDLLISYKCRKLSFADKLCRLLPLLSLAFRTCKFVFVNPAVCISRCWFYRICESCYLYMEIHALLYLCVLIYVFVHPCFVLSANPDVCIPECLLCYIYD